MPAVTQPALTVGEIARRLGASIHRVQYVIRTRKVEHAATAGVIRIYTEADVAFIADELRRIDDLHAGSTEFPPAQSLNVESADE